MKHVVMFSGGLGSWITAKRVVELAHPRDDSVVLLFADVASGRSPHVGEDEDAYRFIREAAADVDAPLVTVRDGRDIWQVFHDDRFLGNTRLANCSKFLKQKPCREWLEANCDPADTVVYVGIDWTELHRLPAIEAGWTPYPVYAAADREPYLDRDDMQRMCEAAGIEVPRLYRAGFPHNNCGGFCVRAGQAQMELLLREHPERYAFHEVEEQELRDYLDKDVAVLRDRTGGTLTPLTLTGPSVSASRTSPTCSTRSTSAAAAASPRPRHDRPGADLRASHLRPPRNPGHRNLGMRHAHPPPRPRPLLRAAQDPGRRRRRRMKATHEQTCPRCPDPILPGQVIIPTPRGWTHATCIPGDDDE
jgi:hypothetical protein